MSRRADSNPALAYYLLYSSPSRQYTWRKIIVDSVNLKTNKLVSSMLKQVQCHLYQNARCCDQHLSMSPSVTVTICHRQSSPPALNPVEKGPDYIAMAAVYHRQRLYRKRGHSERLRCIWCVQWYRTYAVPCHKECYILCEAMIDYNKPDHSDHLSCQNFKSNTQMCT